MPCSPGMTACKASCAHRALVESYRSERDRQRGQVLEQAGGYDTEIADIEQQRRDASPRGRAYPTFADWLIDNRRPAVDLPIPEPELGPPRTPIYANGTAERTLLSHVMAGSSTALRAVLRLHPNEFVDTVHREVANVIHNWSQLQPGWLSNAPEQIETYLREQTNLPRTLDWDSTLPLGDRPPWQFGLHGWADQSRPLGPDPEREIDALASEIRKNSQAETLDRVSAWTESALAVAFTSPQGLAPGDVLDIAQAAHQQTGAVIRSTWKGVNHELMASLEAEPLQSIVTHAPNPRRIR